MPPRLLRRRLRPSVFFSAWIHEMDRHMSCGCIDKIPYSAWVGPRVWLDQLAVGRSSLARDLPPEPDESLMFVC